jgi:hypothetical protein
MMAWLLMPSLAGCNPLNKGGVESSSVGWVPIEGMSVGIGAFDGKIAVIVWCEVLADGSAMNSSLQNGARWHCWLRSQGKTIVEWDCSASRGGSGNMTINKSSFDLRNGNVFLVHQGKAELEITQLRKDTQSLAPNPSEIIEWAQQDPDIQLFVRGNR